MVIVKEIEIFNFYITTQNHTVYRTKVAVILATACNEERNIISRIECRDIEAYTP